MTLVLDRGGTSLDHVAIGVPDTKAGVAQMAEILGCEPYLFPSNPESFYWSGFVPLGDGKFLEILGPSPDYRGFNPFIEMVKRLERPEPLFWYVATDDFDAFCAKAKDAGGPVERITEHQGEREGKAFDFIRGIIGPGFLTVSPNVIEWRARSNEFDEEAEVRLNALNLSHPEAERINGVFQKLGIDQTVAPGAHRMELVLDTPKGEVSFAGDGLEIRGISVLPRLAGYFIRWLLNGRR